MSPSILAISYLSAAFIFGGPKKPLQFTKYASYPCSLSVGTLGASAERSFAVIPKIRTWSPAAKASLNPVERI